MTRSRTQTHLHTHTFTLYVSFFATLFGGQVPPSTSFKCFVRVLLCEVTRRISARVVYVVCCVVYCGGRIGGRGLEGRKRTTTKCACGVGVSVDTCVTCVHVLVYLEIYIYSI